MRRAPPSNSDQIAYAVDGWWALDGLAAYRAATRYFHSTDTARTIVAYAIRRFLICKRLVIALAVGLSSLIANSAAPAYQPKFADPLLESFRWHRIPELTERSFRCMEEGPGGVMWFGVSDGVCSYDGVNWKTYRPEAGEQTPVLSICVADDGTVFATDSQTVWQLRDGSWQQLFAVPEVRKWEIYKLTWTADGSLWVGTNYGLLRLLDGRLHLYAPEQCLEPMRKAAVKAEMHAVAVLKSPDFMCPVYNVEPAGAEKVLVRTRDGIYSFAHRAPGPVVDTWQELSSLEKYWHPLRATVVCETADGATWGLGDNGVVERIRNGASKRWDLRELVNGDVTVSIAESHDGSIWVGGQGALFVFRDNAWHAYAQPDIPCGGAARITVLPASDGSVWIGSEQNDVYRIEVSEERLVTIEDLNFFAETPDGRRWFLDKQGRAVSANAQLADWKSYGPEEGLIDSPVALYVTNQGQLWAAGGDGLEAAVSWFDRSQWKSKTFPGLCWSIDYRSVFEALDGTLWFGATANTIPGREQTGGILRYAPRIGTPDQDHAWQRVELYEPRTSAYGIGQTGDGTMWFGGVDLMSCDAATGKKAAIVTPPFPRDARIDNLHTTADHRIWVATRNYGVASFDGKKWQHFDASNGLLHNTIITSFELADGDVLLGTEHDVSRFDGNSWTNHALPSEFNMQREGGDFRQTDDGAIWISISSRGWKRRALDHDIYDPAKQQFWTCRRLPEERSPATTITTHEPEVSSRGNTVIAWQGTDQWHATARDELRYSYRFDDGEWSPYTADTESVFTALASGEHTFEVRARDRDFNVDPNPPRVRFRVTPPWWKQAWFLGVMGLVAVAAAVGVRSYSVHRWNSALREINVQLEDRIQQRTVELEETNAELEAFAHSVSHDLRAPLRALEGFAIALEEDCSDKLDDHGREFVHHIAASAQRMDMLIRDLLEYSRLGRANLKIQSTSLNQVVRDALRELAAEVESTGASIDVAEPLPTVKGHRATLIRVAMNLISNALKFVRPDTRPEVKVWSEQTGCDRIRLFVEDRGIGIEERHQARIFRMFERLHGTETYPGTGVGLAIVIRACERLGGSCGVESAVDQGSRFWVELPASD
jgi:signal transduction histidine kinase/ligand-binding sensor domain-containing protein